MSTVGVGSAHRAGRFRASAVLFAVGFALLLAQTVRTQTPSNTLNFFNNYFLTGDYVVAGVGLRGLGGLGGSPAGIATGSITISSIDKDAEVVGAFLYWQVVSKDSLGPDSGAVGATFNGYPLNSADGPLAKVLDRAGTAPCWSSGGGTGGGGGTIRTYTYRADVRRFLNADSKGRVVGNGTYVVQVPDSGSSGNGVPVALGASLVVIYRDPRKPFNAIVLYDGGLTIDNNTRTYDLTLRGFYQPKTAAAEITYVVGSGQANKSENVYFNGALEPWGVNPFSASLGPSWDTLTRAVTLASVAAPLPYGASVTTRFDTTGLNGGDCLTPAMVGFKTEVLDTDGDGLLNIWESPNATPLLEPNGQPLPNLNAMGADPGRKDIFVQIDYMSSDGDTYGGFGKPAHDHLPDPAALKMVGEAFAAKGISIHFDVGSQYQGGEAGSYVIPYSSDPTTNLARGGKAIDESVTLLGCPGPTCQFPDYPGTVGWKVGFKFYRDQLLSATPPPLDAAGNDPCDVPSPTPGSSNYDGPGGACERRFDRNRLNMFRYALGAHALGISKSEYPCLDGSTPPVPVGALADGSCAVAPNPEFHIPRTSSGVGDFPGADLMLTLGGFNDAAGRPVGTPFMQASTLMHELGHNFDLGHSGVYVPGVAAEPGCKPNYLSSMNYLFQLRGLYNDLPPLGTPRLDYSNEVLDGIDEVNLMDGPLGGVPSYHTGWYAPKSLFTTGTAATKHCDGSPLSLAEFNSLAAGGGMVRVDGPSAISVSSPWTSRSIDWNPDPAATSSQDINFDGKVQALQPGSNDWANLRLNQLATRRNVLGLSIDLGRDGLGRGDTLGRDGLGRDGLGRDGLGRDGLGRDGLGRDGLGRDGLGRDGLGRDGLGRDGLGIAGLGRDGLGLEEVDTAIASASGHAAPNTFTACQIGVDGCSAAGPSLPFHRIVATWNATAVNPDLVVRYDVYRFKTADGLSSATRVGSVPGPASSTPPPPGTIQYSLVDTEELPNGSFTYYAIAVFTGDSPGPSSPSNPLITIDVVNVAPVPNAIVPNDDSYSIGLGQTLIVAAPGVLGNDTDVDSAVLRAAQATAPSHGALTLLADGSFSYTPTAGFLGIDTFTYSVVDVDPTNARSATVSITIRDITPPVVTLTVPAPNARGWYTTKPVTVGVSATDPSGVTAIGCVDIVNGTPSAISLSLTGAGTTTASGSLSLTAEGTHSVSCSATDGAGNTGAATGSSPMPATVRIDTVAPAVTIAAPLNNATPILKSTSASNFSCSDGTTPPASGLASCVGTVASGSNINTATVGPKTFAVTATDVAGNTTTVTNTYTVIYAMTLQPLKTPANQGSAVPVQWALKDALGNPINSLATLLRMESVFNGAVPATGCVASATGTRELLYSPATGATGGSNFRLVTGGYQFNWDTTTTSTAPIITGKGCYTVLIYLDERPDLTNPRMTTSVQLK